MSTNPPTFRTILRGFDPAQVEAALGEMSTALETARREAADRTVELAKAQAVQRQVSERLDSMRARIHELEEAQRTASSPTYRDLGERIASILTLADEEAAEVRGVATLDAQKHRDESATAAAAVRAESDRYAEEVRTKAEAEAARVVEDAKKSADAMLDHADRESAARREEAEALFESQRAKAASAAADFETTLAERRDRAAAEFAALLAGHEQTLSSVQTQAEQLARESQTAHQEARTAANATLETANEEAALMVQQAREQADRIRRDSERELAAATARRDSINAQLTNVRQMLATLGGPALAQQVAATIEEAPLAAVPADEGTADGEALAPGQDDAVEDERVTDAAPSPEPVDGLEDDDDAEQVAMDEPDADDADEDADHAHASAEPAPKGTSAPARSR